MALSDELDKLDGLRQRGVLSDEEFARAKARLLDALPGAGTGASLGTGATAAQALNGLRRSLADRWIGGVCAGMARATGVEAWAWRLGFVALSLWGGAGVLIYALLWLFVPSE
jgi:phage shock protein C